MSPTKDELFRRCKNIFNFEAAVNEEKVNECVKRHYAALGIFDLLKKTVKCDSFAAIAAKASWDAGDDPDQIVSAAQPALRAWINDVRAIWNAGWNAGNTGDAESAKDASTAKAALDFWTKVMGGGRDAWARASWDAGAKAAWDNWGAGCVSAEDISAVRAIWDTWARASWDTGAKAAVRAAWDHWSTGYVSAEDISAVRAIWDTWARASWDTRWDTRNVRVPWDVTHAVFQCLATLEKSNEKLLEIWMPVFEAAENGLWFWYYLDGTFAWVPRPRIKLNEKGELHCESSAAFELPDQKLYFWKSVRVPEHVIMNPSKISIAGIEKETNVEVRRIMIERYGHIRYLLDSGSTLIHKDEWGSLYIKKIPRDEPLVMVKVVNSTPESDGSFKDYFLRVHPELRPMPTAVNDYTTGEPQELTALNAVASTFGFTGEEYKRLLVQQT